jgi:hypothetical protein
MQVNVITVEVTRDAMTRIVADVPAHEIEVQQVVFGHDNVNVLNDSAGVTELEEGEEADRLARKYGESAVTDTYGANYSGKVVAAMKANAAPEADAAPKRGRPAKTEE